MKKELEHIYTAKQCTDLNDVDTAMEAIRELSKKYKNSRLLQKKYNSLHKKWWQLANKMSGNNRKYKINLGDRIIVSLINSESSFSIAEAVKFLENKYKSEKNYTGIEVQK